MIPGAIAPIVHRTILCWEVLMARFNFQSAAAAVCVVSAIMFSSVCRADVIFVGGAPAQKQALLALFNSLPACCRQNVQIRVQLMPETELVELVRSGLSGPEAQSVNAESIDGVYQNDSPTITLRQESGGDELSKTFAHEMGHFVWQRILTDSQRKQYNSVYKTQKSAHCLVTAYSATSVEEGFAEAYSYQVTSPSILQSRDRLSSKFIQNIFSD
jgi:hypothetical protein